MRERKEIKKILINLLGYSNPEYLNKDLKNGISLGEDFNKEITEKYYQIIFSIDWFLKKISRYEVYFIEFYPLSKKIKNYEALEHHIHAYLEDMETLKNKLTYYVGCLKNDLKKNFDNKKEISRALDWLREQIVKVFKNASDIRGKHRHKGNRFVDPNIISIETIETLFSKNNPLKKQLTPRGLETLNKRKFKSFQKAKKFWIETAKKNLSQVEGVTNETMKKTKDFLYQLLDINPIDL